MQNPVKIRSKPGQYQFYLKLSVTAVTLNPLMPGGNKNVTHT